MNPFALIYGLPVATSSRLLPENESSIRLSADFANNSIQSATDSELVRLDGETYRTSLVWKRGLASDWQVGIEIPYLSHNSGVMDGPIEQWHNLFGISNSSRDDWSRNRLVYRYDNGDGEQLLVDSTSSGIGDIALSLSHALKADGDRRVAAHASLKLATGDSGQLLGSGAPDLALWLSASGHEQFWQLPLSIYGQGGVLFKGEGDLVPDQQRDLVLFGSLGAGWRPVEWLELKAQIDGNTPHYHSRLNQLGSEAILLTLGGSLYLDGNNQRIDISFGENLTTDSVPDFMINLSYVYRFINPATK